VTFSSVSYVYSFRYRDRNLATFVFCRTARLKPLSARVRFCEIIALRSDGCNLGCDSDMLGGSGRSIISIRVEEERRRECQRRIGRKSARTNLKFFSCLGQMLSSVLVTCANIGYSWGSTECFQLICESISSSVGSSIEVDAWPYSRVVHYPDSNHTDWSIRAKLS
jgi:hypothetical protein